jgi:hypothetical protein
MIQSRMLPYAEGTSFSICCTVKYIVPCLVFITTCFMTLFLLQQLEVMKIWVATQKWISSDVQDRSPWPCLMNWNVLIRQLIWIAMNSTKKVYAIDGKKVLKNVCFYDQQLPQKRGRFYLKVDFFSIEEGLNFFYPMPVKGLSVIFFLQSNIILTISTICPGYWHYPCHLSDWHLWMWSSSISSTSPLNGKSFNPILFGKTYLELVFNLPNDAARGIFGTYRAVCARVKEVNLKVKTFCCLLHKKNRASRMLSEDLDYCDERGNSGN